MRRTIAGLLVPALALAAVIASGTWMVAQGRDAPWSSSAWEDTGWRGWGGTIGPESTYGGMMGGAGYGGMMGGAGWLDGESTPVTGLEEARAQVKRFADATGNDLRVGELMRFEDNYYAQLEDSDGAKVTEVLVDPRTGGVQIEFGPAMMWNTTFGMSSFASQSPRLSADQARAAAQEVLPAGVTLGPADAFPGYFTLHTISDGTIQGMLSVNAFTGDVWEHTWHGPFVEMSESE